MEYRRYGKFRFNDYTASWIGIAILVFFSVASIIFKLPTWYAILPGIYAIIWLLTILMSNTESYSISENKFLAKKGSKIKEIEIPSEITIIVSYADICPPLAVRTAYGNQTHILRDKYAVTVFQIMPIDFIIECLYRGYIKKHTTSTVRRSFDEYRYVYGFVCVQEVMDKLIANRNCLLIIPKSLQDKIFIDASCTNVNVEIIPDE